jgi:pSer/pThr/pTyr-binding forkhead associated (FHA) protein
VIGSSEICDARLVHPDVSRLHLYIQIVEGQAHCFDMGSRTGTYWGRENRSQGVLSAGERIHLGPFSLALGVGDPGQAAAAETLEFDHTNRFPPANIVLTFLNARSRSGRMQVSRIRRGVTLFGWSHLCNLRMEHHSVGRVHGSLVWTPAGLWAVDLRSRKGTSVNGNPIEFVRLEDHDSMEVGRFHLKVAYGSSGEVTMQSDNEQPIAAQPETRPAEGNLTRIAALSEPVAPSPLAPALPVPVAANLAGAPGEGAMAMALMQQFATMQQQMFDHTYQLLAQVTEAFQAAHNRQLQLIREEMMRVHELNRELFELNRQRASTGNVSPEATAAQAVDSSLVGQLQQVPVAEAKVEAFETRVAAGMSGVPIGPISIPYRVFEPAGDRASGPRETLSPPESSASAPKSNQQSAAPAPSRRRKSPRTGEPGAVNASAETSAAASPPTVSSDENVHAWVTSRINELTQERNTRWQRILQLLTSGGS